MKSRLIAVCVTALCAVSFYASSILAESTKEVLMQSGNRCENILVTKCSDCHYLNRVCSKLGKKSKSGWRRSIKRMIRKGAILSKEEQTLLVQCLHEKQEGAKSACSK